MNEEVVKKLVKMLDRKPMDAEAILDIIEKCIVMHRYKDSITFVFSSSLLPTKEGGEAMLEALRRISGDDAKKRMKLAEMMSYWLTNYDGIMKVMAGVRKIM